MIESKWIKGTQGMECASTIRRKVFIEEQNISECDEFDEIDNTCEHLIIYDNSIPIATGRLYIKDGIYVPGRIAVIKEMRGKGIGDLVIKMLLYKGINMGAQKFKLSAQVYAKEFYTRYGFEPIGEIYDDCNITHIDMIVEAQNCKFPTKCNNTI